MLGGDGEKIFWNGTVLMHQFVEISMECKEWCISMIHQVEFKYFESLLRS
jgi:hypothetical protein